MHIAYLTSEVYPFSKTGGLADVGDGLPAALAAVGVGVTVFSPFYRSVRSWGERNQARWNETELPYTVQMLNEPRTLRYQVLGSEGRQWVFVDDGSFYDRPELYTDETGADYVDNVARFSHLCRAALEYCLGTGELPDLFHVHDWQSSLLPVYLRNPYGGSAVAGRPCLLTIHNLGYQGLFPADHLAATGLDGSVFHIEGLEFYGQLNLLKGGVVFADAVTTVSPSYAQEIMTEEFGCGLHGVLQAHEHKLTGILNGIDTELWNPETDPYLPARYDHENLAGKAECKRALQQRVGLPRNQRAVLLGVVSRLAEQKGITLIAEAFPALADLDVQLVILGTGDRDAEEALLLLVAQNPERVACIIGFDESLAHLIEAGADAFLMPSAYEPCGLNQMYSQRYGTVPIVHATGGIKDTVVDTTPVSLASGTATGFSFEPWVVEGLIDAIRRAVRLCREEPDTWRGLLTRIMRLDRGWLVSASEYRELYERLVNARP